MDTVNRCASVHAVVLFHNYRPRLALSDHPVSGLIGPQHLPCLLPQHAFDTSMPRCSSCLRQSAGTGPSSKSVSSCTSSVAAAQTTRRTPGPKCRSVAHHTHLRTRHQLMRRQAGTSRSNTPSSCSAMAKAIISAERWNIDPEPPDSRRPRSIFRCPVRKWRRRTALLCHAAYFPTPDRSPIAPFASNVGITVVRSASSCGTQSGNVSLLDNCTYYTPAP